MTRKLKLKVDKNKKKNTDELYNFYLKSLDNMTRRKLTKESLNKIYKAIEHYSVRKFSYLAFESLVISIARIEKYLNEDVAFSKEIGFADYLKLSEKIAREISEDLKIDTLSKNILEIMSSNFIKEMLQNENEIEYITTDLTGECLHELNNLKDFTKQILVKDLEVGIEFLDEERMKLVVLKHTINGTLKYLEIREVDYIFLQDMSKVLKAMNLILKTIETNEKEEIFLSSYQKCIYDLQRITDYIYFKDILSVSFDNIPEKIKFI